MSHSKYTSHHVVPKSRGGKNTCDIPGNFHEAWHTCFQNLYGDEIILFISKLRKMMKVQDKVTSREIHDLRIEVKKKMKRRS